MGTLLFALPYAGGGASLYRSWPETTGVRVHGVQLPGREELFDEPWPLSMADTIARCVRQVVERSTGDDNVALFGHSFGAVLAYEVARHLVADGRTPVHLFASGSVDPTTPLGRDPAQLSDTEFVGRVESLAGYTHPALAIPDLREIVLPVLRADVRMHETYRTDAERPLPVPVTALRGTSDHLVSADDCARWAKVTSAVSTVVQLPGGHMYFVDDPQPLLTVIERTLES
ncbi:thioesterase II family protein [Micromonospora inyonensis]|uniref:Surfactin synthase thioesterase subunit n=1 Tax=Micromonospora inyonensis TaxID=47866 RepID=A0A1C6S7B1_9ACTN|nr:alpha/beta fold hydrolase [Micromonospora inyonensis]SCL25333.1 Surfactin synthase thioesterase subunit [Micromonospora inyonensis]